MSRDRDAYIRKVIAREIFDTILMMHTHHRSKIDRATSTPAPTNDQLLNGGNDGAATTSPTTVIPYTPAVSPPTSTTTTTAAVTAPAVSPPTSTTTTTAAVTAPTPATVTTTTTTTPDYSVDNNVIKDLAQDGTIFAESMISDKGSRGVIPYFYLSKILNIPEKECKGGCRCGKYKLGYITAPDMEKLPPYHTSRIRVTCPTAEFKW